MKSDQRSAKNSSKLAANFCFKGVTAAWVSQRTSGKKTTISSLAI